MDVYEELFEAVKDTDDSLWPDWLFNPAFNDFDDNYYIQSFAEDETTMMVKKLKHRYNDFFEWVDAMSIYNEYMSQMIEKYGSLRVIKNALEVDMMDDPIPSKPKLKNNRKNRQFLRSGTIPSRRDPEIAVSGEEMLAIARQAFPGQMGEDVDEELSNEPLPKETKKRLREIQRVIDGEERRRNMYRSIGNNSGTDFITAYLNNAMKGIYDSSGNITGNNDQSLMEIVKEMERIENTRPELLEDESMYKTTVVGNRLVRQADLQRTEVYKELYQEGFDILHSLGRSGLDKKSVKMIRSQIGASEPMTKKELKKMKKRAKKDQARIQRRADASNLLEKTLLGNRLDTRRDSDGNISLRLRDLYRD